MNIRERAIELLQLFAQIPPPTEDQKITMLEMILMKIYQQGVKDGGDNKPTIVEVKE